jgi:hypothetical protein
MAKDYSLSFQYTLKDGRPVTVYCADYTSGDYSINVGAGFETIWLEDSDGNIIDSIPDLEFEAIDYKAAEAAMDYGEDLD